MPALKAYGDYYDGSAARKIEKKQAVTREISKNRRVGKNKLNKKVSKRKNALVVFSILCGFSMAMLITYRYNMISEKNLEAQKLKNKLATVEGALLNKQIEVEQNTDLTKVESYAKQQLGMQKPDKNQTIYVDTSKSVNTVETNKEVSMIEEVLSNIKNFISKIF